MSSDYWMGVLSVPAFVLGAAALWIALKAVGKVGERLLVGGIMTMGMTAKLTKRIGMASMVFGAKRSYMVAAGDVAVLIIVGKDDKQVVKAAERLYPPMSLRDFTKPSTATATTSAAASADDGQ